MNLNTNFYDHENAYYLPTASSPSRCSPRRMRRGEPPAGQNTTTEQTDAPHATGTHEHHDHAHYQCPMKCEGDKTYEEPGACPVCKMDLAEVKGVTNHLP